MCKSQVDEQETDQQGLADGIEKLGLEDIEDAVTEYQEKASELLNGKGKFITSELNSKDLPSLIKALK